MTTGTMAPATSEQVEELTELVRELVLETRQRRQMRETVADLTSELTPIARDGLESASRALAQIEERGYVEFARGGLSVIDNVVSSFGAEDLESLGDNIVLILETVKEMTQPQVMQMLQSTFHEVSDLDAGGPPPSILGLLRQLREPGVRAGLARLIAALRNMGIKGMPQQGKEEPT